MFRILDISGKCILCGALALAIFLPPDRAFAKGFRTLYAFKGGSDGAYPQAALIKDRAGNLYGTTYYGGGATGCNAGCGTVFKLASDGSETVLHVFTGGSDGGFPAGGLIEDKAGNLYGTTYAGGADKLGTVFKMAPDGTETVLHSFTAGKDGGYPAAGLIADKKGNMYGTTLMGGHYLGTVFKVAPDGTETVLYAFAGAAGAYPVASLIRDEAGNLYGTAEYGGANQLGTIFKLSPKGTATVLFSFGSGADGPEEGLVADSAGNLYTTVQGGDYGFGAVFRFASDGTGTVLYSFPGGSAGASPFCGLILDAAGNLYGTTSAGGGGVNAGNVFRLAPDGSESVLHLFTGANDGAVPLAGLIADKKGHLYGTTSRGGTDNVGTVFELKE